MQFSSSVPSGQSCQPSHTDSSARHSPFPQENSAGLQVSIREGSVWQGMGSGTGTFQGDMFGDSPQLMDCACVQGTPSTWLGSVEL